MSSDIKMEEARTSKTGDGHVMEEIEVVMRKFGDEKSNLLDQFERLSFEIQLNQAILGRSLSEPGTMGGRATKFLPPVTVARAKAPATGPPLVSKEGKGRSRRRLGFGKVLKKLLKPIMGRKKEVAPDPRDPKFWKNFSRSLRF